MLAFVGAVLITAVLFRVIADVFIDEQDLHAATEVTATDRPRAAGRSSQVVGLSYRGANEYSPRVAAMSQCKNQVPRSRYPHSCASSIEATIDLAHFN
jgi:hypothetical protein